jgi:pyruvate dehydrogenase E1 component alpha subunit
MDQNSSSISFQNPPSDRERDLACSLYYMMEKIRIFEEKVAKLIENKEIIDPCHLYIGQEGVAAGVCHALTPEDWVFSNHRSHGHYIAKKGDINSLMAEIFCKATGCSRGRGGSMHLCSPEIGFPGSSAIVAGTISLAVGAALSFSMKNVQTVAVSFFGDGATNEGVLYEALNFAALKKLPIVFICENNLYSTHMPIAECLANTDIYKKAEAMGVPAVRVDGNDVLEVYQATSSAVTAAREGNGPAFIECMTYRWLGHVGPNNDLDKGLRSKEELEQWIERDPIRRFQQYISNSNITTPSELQKMKSQIQSDVEHAVEFARSSPYPQEDGCFSDVFR